MTTIETVDCWRSYHCDTRYSVSLCDDEGGEIRCVGGADDIDEAWALAVDEAREHGVPARLMPHESGEVTRTWEPMPMRDPAALAAEVGAMVGDDGSGDLRVIVEQALRDDPSVTAEAIAEIVGEARAEWAVERAHEAGE
jgi:hypothetical protein